MGNLRIRKNRKAVFFSIVSILIVILFTTMIRLSSDISVKETELEITRTRIKVLNSLIKNMEETYFDKMIYVAGKNSLIGLSKYYTDNFDRMEKSLFKAVEDTIDDSILYDKWGNPINLTRLGYMEYDYTTQALIKNVSALFENMGIEVRELEINFSKGTIKQEDPWHIILEADVIYDFRDINELVSWRGSTHKEVEISVIGLYSYDYEGHGRGNKARITDSWIIDLGDHYTEPSLITKLSEDRSAWSIFGLTDPSEYGKGLCSPNFEDPSCADDEDGDY